HERNYSALFYLTPGELPDAPTAFWVELVASSIPFMAIGFYLTVRRLRDARLSPWFAAFFFLPYVKFLFFAVCAVLPPSRRKAQTLEVVDAPYRSASVELPGEAAPEPPAAPEPDVPEAGSSSVAE